MPRAEPASTDDGEPASGRKKVAHAAPAKTKASKPRKPRAKRASASSNGEVRLTGDRLVVRTPEGGERTSTGGLLIPATAVPAPKRLTWGDVQLVGPDVRVASTGDRVLFLPSSGLEVELDGEDLVLLRERDVQAVAAAASKADRAPGQYL
jgi:chaperonin GroES